MDSRRDEMLVAALEAFAARGYDGTSIADLASVTGMSKAAFTYHFTAKQDILVELAEPLISELEQVIVAHQNSRQPAPIEALLGDYLGVLLRHRKVAAWVDGDKSVLSHPQIGERLRHNNATMRRLLTGGDADPAASVRASAVLGAIWRPIRNLTEIDVSAQRSEILTAALQGLAEDPLDGPVPY